MVDFIRKGYQELSGTRVERELQNEKKNLANCGIRTRGLPLTKRMRSVEWIKVCLVLTLLFSEIYLQHMVDVVKYFVVNYIL